MGLFFKLWCGAVFFVLASTLCGEVVEKSNILVLHSYNQGLLWSDNINKGVNSIFEPHCNEVELHYEYLDTKRYPINDQRYIQQLSRFQKNKVFFDVVIVVDNNALNFLRRDSALLFPDTPIVFCGINGFKTSLIHGLQAVTGVTEDPDHQATLDLMMSLHPDRKNVVVFVDRTPTGNAIYRQLEPVVKRYNNQLTFEFCRDVAIGEMPEVVSLIDDNSMIYLLSYNRDSNQKFISYKEVGKIMSENSCVPVYGCWEFYFGECIVGGKIISGSHQGAKAAAKALKILQGADIGDIPIDRNSNNLYMFDWLEMEKFDIEERDLPKGAKIINPPLSLIRRYQTEFYIVLLLSLVLIFVLFIRNIRFRYNQRVLLEANKNLDAAVSAKTRELTELLVEFKSIFDTSVIGIAEVEMDGVIRRANERFTDILHRSSGSLSGSSIYDLESGEEVRSVIEQLTVEAAVDELRYQGELFIKRRGVDDIWCFISAQTFQTDTGEQKIILVIDDISERKRLEALKDDVARIIQHDLKGSLLGIISLPQLLVSTGEWSAQQLDALKAIESSGQRMLEMINSSLTIYKIETGAYSFIPEPTDIVEILHDITRNFEKLAEMKQINIVIDVVDGDKGRLVQGEALLCSTVFENLLKNAIEASPVGQEVTVTVVLENLVTVTVGNFGSVPALIRDSFFDKYISVNKETGTGLGTYSARLFTEAMNGKISLVSETEYTKIVVTLKAYHLD